MNTTSTVAPGQNSVIGVLVGIYTLILGVGTLCVSVISITGGALLGGLGSAIQQSGVNTNDAATAAAAAQLSGIGGGVIALIGFALLLIAIGLIAVGVGDFMRRNWAYNGTVLAHGIYAVLSGVSILANARNGLPIFSIVLVIISVVIVVLFLTNADVKRSFGRV